MISNESGETMTYSRSKLCVPIYTLERLLESGAYSRTPLEEWRSTTCRLGGTEFPPGRRVRSDVGIPATVSAGRYRLSTTVILGDRGTARVTSQLFDVVAQP